MQGIWRTFDRRCLSTETSGWQRKNSQTSKETWQEYLIATSDATVKMSWNISHARLSMQMNERARAGAQGSTGMEQDSNGHPCAGCMKMQCREKKVQQEWEWKQKHLILFHHQFLGRARLRVESALWSHVCVVVIVVVEDPPPHWLMPPGWLPPQSCT